MLANLPALVLAACILVTAATGEALGPLWLTALPLAALVQARELWKDYRDG